MNGGSARRRTTTYAQDNINRITVHTDIHVSNGIRTHISMSECAKTVHSLERMVTVISVESLNLHSKDCASNYMIYAMNLENARL
jgi:hypothetical protein